MEDASLGASPRTVELHSATLRGAVTLMAAVADDDALTFAKITGTSTVYVAGRALVGDET